MNDLYWKCMRLECCMECHREIQIDQKMIRVHKDDLKEYWVHDGECHSNYLKSLADPKEVKRGTIFGFCELCGRVVRGKDKFEVTRSSRATTDHKILFVSTIPEKNDIGFVHTKCFDRLDLT